MRFGFRQISQNLRMRSKKLGDLCKRPTVINAPYQRGFAEYPGSEGPERSTSDPCCYRLVRVYGACCRASDKFTFLRTHLGAPPAHTCSLLCQHQLTELVWKPYASSVDVLKGQVLRWWRVLYPSGCHPQLTLSTTHERSTYCHRKRAE